MFVKTKKLTPCACLCMLSRFSHVQLFVTPWTLACQALLSMGIPQAKLLGWTAIPSFRGSFQSRIKSRSPALQADSLLSEPPGKPKNTGVGSLSLLQGILTQESNQGLMHCRRILYQLSYRRSPYIQHSDSLLLYILNVQGEYIYTNTYGSFKMLMS